MHTKKWIARGSRVSSSLIAAALVAPEHWIAAVHTSLSAGLHIRQPPRQGLIEEPGVALHQQKEAGSRWGNYIHSIILLKEIVLYFLHVKMLQFLYTLHMNAEAVKILVNSEITFPNQGSDSSGWGQQNRNKFFKKAVFSLFWAITYLYVPVKRITAFLDSPNLWHVGDLRA